MTFFSLQKSSEPKGEDFGGKWKREETSKKYKWRVSTCGKYMFFYE